MEQERAPPPGGRALESRHQSPESAPAAFAAAAIDFGAPRSSGKNATRTERGALSGPLTPNPLPSMSIPLRSVPSSAIQGRGHLRALPHLPLRLHHPIDERFTCAGCGLVLIVGSPTVPIRPLAFTTLLCDCGHYSLFPGATQPGLGAA